MKVLVTGFDPFGGEQVNPAIEAVKWLPDEIAGAQIIKLEIPTIFDKSAELIHEAIIKNHPYYVINIGQAGGRAAITPELVAINFDDGSIPDNAGFQPIDSTIHIDGPAAYFTQLPVKKMVKAIREAGLPARVSTTAGTYVCNHVMYQVQYMRDKEFPWLKAGLIHIPFLPSQVTNEYNQPSMNLGDIVAGLTAAIGAALA